MGVIAYTHGGHCFNTIYVHMLCSGMVCGVCMRGVVWFDVVYIIHSTVVWDMHAYIGVGVCTVNCAYILQGKGKRFKSKSDLRMYVRTYIRTYVHSSEQ